MDKRSKFRIGLCSLYLPYYDALCSELPDYWQPYSGYRSFEDQNLLWKKGRVIGGKIVTNANAGESAHNYGAGSDWTIWEGPKPLWINKDDRRWDEYVDAIIKVGLRPGKEFGDYDHNELKLCCNWPAILAVFNGQGSITAYQKIEECIIKGDKC